jgi:hypothetical protein
MILLQSWEILNLADGRTAARGSENRGCQRSVVLLRWLQDLEVEPFCLRLHLLLSGRPENTVRASIVS